MSGRFGRVVALAVVVLLTGCGGSDQDVAEVEAPTATPQDAYAAVIEAYVDQDCDRARSLVAGTDTGVEQFVGGCEERENVEVVRSLTAQDETLPSSLDPLPDGASEAVRLTAAFTDESGQATDYYPDMVLVDGTWKLWLPGDA